MNPCSFLLAATALALSILPGPLAAGQGSGVAGLTGTTPGASAWSTGMHSSVRLLDAGPDAAAPKLWRAGLEIRLDPHFKTYWRTPGDSGLPPVFDWSGSQNLASVEVLWPAPFRFEDTAGSSIGYVGDTVLPLRVTLTDPRKPAVLNLRLDYAVCEKVCIPAHGETRLTLSPTGVSTPHGSTVAESENRVPRSAPLGATEAPSLRSVTAAADGSSITVAALVPEKASIVDIFTEGPELWVFGAPVAIATVPHAPGVRLVTYVVPVQERPTKTERLGGVALRFTMTAGPAAIETAVTLDGKGSAP